MIVQNLLNLPQFSIRMSNKELLKEFEHAFEVIKKELKFKASLKELDEVFFLNDLIAKEGFVSTQLSRMVCRRLLDTLFNYYGYFQSLILPNPQSMWQVPESQIFNDQEKSELIKFMDKIMILSTRNLIIGLKKSKSEEGKLIDDCLSFWNSELNPKLIEIASKSNAMWTKKSVYVHQPKKAESNMFG